MLPDWFKREAADWARKEGTSESTTIAGRTMLFSNGGKWKRKRLPLEWHYVRTVYYTRDPVTDIVVPITFDLYLDRVGSYCLN